MKLMQLELKKINWRPYLGAACGLLAFGLSSRVGTGRG